LILAVVEDLIFLSKIQQSAQPLGVAVKATEPTKLAGEFSEALPHAVILDLNHRSGLALEVLRTLKGDPARKHVPVIGFVSHVQADLVNAAHEAGCDLVVARSAFTHQLPELLGKLTRSATSLPT
jgi:CheY-like chemotaxis protein